MIKSLTLGLSATIRDAIQTIESSRLSMAVIIDEMGVIKGTITDGDVRRALLSGNGLDDLATVAFNATPIIADASTTDQELQALFSLHQIEAIPLVDSSGLFMRVAHISIFRPDVELDARADFYAAVIMAGGEGQRFNKRRCRRSARCSSFWGTILRTNSSTRRRAASLSSSRRTT